MASFDDAFALVMAYEGWGASNSPIDKGGPTICGVSSATWPEQYEYIRAARSTEERNSRVAAFYRKWFWNTLGLAQLRSQDLANQVMDFAVTSGAHIAITTLQECLNHPYVQAHAVFGKLKEDGLLGPRTACAANGEGSFVYQLYRVKRAMYYAAICVKDFSQYGNFASWMRRI